jgi:hypothetical protein
VETLKGNPLQQWNTATSMGFIYLIEQESGKTNCKVSFEFIDPES